MKINYRNIDKRFIHIEYDNIPSRNNLTVVSLFSGAGGFDLGLEMAGFKTVACIENDEHCRETIRFNRPEWILIEDDRYISVDGKMSKRIPGDIRDIDADEVLFKTGLKKGECSLIVGGAPCQPFSNIGKKLGKDDERNGDLFLSFVRFIKGIEPKSFIFENVTGITQSKHNEVIEYMLEKLSGLGYSISYGIVNAAHYGVPQKRERFFLIGLKGSDVPAFPLPTHFKQDLKLWKQYLTENKLPQTLPMLCKWNTVGDTFKLLNQNRNLRDDYAILNVSEKVIERMKYISQGQNFKVVPTSLLPECWKSGKHQGSDTFGRMIEDEPSNTIRTAAYNPSKGMYIHPTENRGLDSLEIAALQTFPEEWYFKCKGRKKVTLVSVGKQIGNAVPPLLAKALGIALKKQLNVL